MWYYRIPSIFTSYRRNIGYIARFPTPQTTKYETPADIASYLEKCSRLLSQNESVDFESCKNLIDETLSRITQFTVSEVRTVSHCITEMFNGNIDPNWYKIISDFTLKRSYVMPVYFLVPLMNSVCKMGMRDINFYNKVLSIFIDRIDEANSIDLATVSQTLVLIKSNSIPVDQNLVSNTMTQVSKICMEERILNEISATNSVMVLYSFAKLNILDVPLFKTLLSLIKDINKEDFEPHLIPLVLHVFSIFKIKENEHLKVIFDYIYKFVHNLTYQNIANCLNSLAKLNIRNYHLIKVLVQNFKNFIDTVKVRELANVLWSLSKLKYNDPELIEELLNKATGYDYIDPVSYAQIFDSMNGYGINREDLIDNLLTKYKPTMKESPTHVITQVAWSCSNLEVNKYNIINESLEELSRRKLNSVEQKYVDKILDFEGDRNSCVTRVRFSHLRGDSLAVGVDSLGYIRLMDLKAQKSSNYKYFDNLFLENDMILPHLCDFSFSNCGRCVYVSSSDGFVSISALNMVGNHLNKDNHLLTIHDTHIGGTFCVYPSPDYDFMIYTGGGDGFLRLWDLRLMSNKNIYNLQDNNSGNKVWSKPLMSLWAHVTPLSSMNVDLSNRIITSGFNENVRIWDTQSMLPIQTIDGGNGNLSVWDILVDKKRSKVFAVGDSGNVSVFDYEGDEESFSCKNSIEIEYDKGERNRNVGFINEDQLLFRNWRRICQYGNKLVIPSLDGENFIKAFIIDIDNNKVIDNLKYPDDSEMKFFNISSVDAHPDPDIGLVLSGGSILNGRCTVWVDKNRDVK